MDSLVKTNPKEDAGAYIEENLELVRKMVEEREELDIPEKVQRAKFLVGKVPDFCLTLPKLTRS